MSELSVPEGWAVDRLGSITEKIQDGTHFSPRSSSGGFRYLTSKNIRSGYIDLSGCGWIDANEHRSIFRRCDPRKGDLLLTKDGANTGNAAINSLNEEFSLLSSVALLRFNPKFHHAGYYLQYLLSVAGYARINDQMSGNAIPRLTLSKIQNFVVPYPPLPEQRKIAQVLGAVDDSIRATERIIQKLHSTKDGMVGELLQRLDVGAEITLDTCIDYIESGDSPDLSDRPASLGEWGVVKVSAVRPEGFDPRENKVVENDSLVRPKLEICSGDLLMTRANTPQLIGLACYVQRPTSRLMLSDKILRIVVERRKLNPHFCAYVLDSTNVRRQIEASGTGSSGSMKNISQGQVRSLRIPHVDIDAQHHFVNQVEAVNARTNSLVAELDKLRGIKRGLAEDLLTGRVRVDEVEL